MKLNIKRGVAAVLLLLLAAVTAGGGAVYAITSVFEHSTSYESSEYYQRLLQVELTDSARENLVRVAESQVGYYEGGIEGDYDGSTEPRYNNFTEYGYNFGDPDCIWCTTFVWWCARQVGLDKSVFPDTIWPRLMTVNCPYVGYTPGMEISRGDILFLENTGDDTPDHLAIVTGVDDDTISTVEGNCGNTVCRMRYRRDTGAILYVGTLNYERDPSIPDASSLAQSVVITTDTQLFDKHTGGRRQGDVQAGETYTLLAVSTDGRWFQIEWKDHAYWLDRTCAEAAAPEASQTTSTTETQPTETTTTTTTTMSTRLTAPSTTHSVEPKPTHTNRPGDNTNAMLLAMFLVVVAVFTVGITLVRMRDLKRNR